MTALDIIQHDGEFVVTSETVANGSGVQHKNVLDLIDANRADFEDFGHLAFETRDRIGTPGPKLRVALLNEQQATLLMTFQRNTDQVRAFKKALVKAFFEMAHRTPAIPDISTPEGILQLAQSFTRTAEALVAAKNEVAELTPLAAQAHVHNLGKEFTTRQDFAREIVKWALYNGIKVTAPQVFEFLARKLDMFVTGNREDNGDATLSGERRGLSTTVKGTSTVNGFAFHTGKLTPKGVEYAWSRAQKYILEHGDLVLRSKENAA